METMQVTTQSYKKGFVFKYEFSLQQAYGRTSGMEPRLSCNWLTDQFNQTYTVNQLSADSVQMKIAQIMSYAVLDCSLQYLYV